MNNFVNLKTYNIHTFGCQMNVHESEKVAGVLESFGLKSIDDHQTADVVVINSCAIRESAEKKIESFIGNLKNPKSKGNVKKIIVFGCMTQQNDRANSLYKKFPFIDIIMGTHNLSNFKTLFEKNLKTNKTIIEILPERTGKDIEQIYRTSGTNAWVNIMHGCNNFCSYCIVPYVRGREVSRPKEEIIDEVQKLLNSGYKQITLLGQNVNSYGNDIEDKNINFANLLKEIDNLKIVSNNNEKEDNKFRIRFMTSHPKDLSDEVIMAIKNSKHICHSIHLPVQSGSTKILNAMNRRYTREHYLNLVDKIKKELPDAELTTDIIVGFPGETEEDFKDTLTLIEKCQFQQIFGFIYSKRRGTVAEKHENHIPLEKNTNI